MEMDADRMANLAPPADHFHSEKAVVLEERRQRTDNDPRALFNEQMTSVLFVNHPYATPIIGWMNEIKKYEWPDVKKFYDTWYAPNNAILVISGDVTVETVKPLTEKYYGSLKPKKVPLRIRPLVPPALAPAFLKLEDAAVHQPMFQKTYIAPAESRKKEESLALQVLAEILSGGPTTRLYKNLVVEQKKATAVDLDYTSTALDYGTIAISAAPADGVSLEEMNKLVDAELRKVVEHGVTEQEVKDAIQRLQDDAVFARDSVSGPAMIFGASMTTGSTVHDIETWPQEVAKVTPARVKAAAEKYLNDAKPWIRPAVIGYLLPKAETTIDGDSHVQK